MARVSLMGLPDDVLKDILDLLSANPLFKERRTTIQKTRLVCRRLCGLASPHLLRCFYINLDREPVRLINIIIGENPLIASGIQKLYIVPKYRPQLLATDFLRFTNYRWKQVQESRNAIYRRMEPLFSKPERTEDDQRQLFAYERATESSYVIKRAWRMFDDDWDPLRPHLDEVMVERLQALSAETIHFNSEECRLRNVLYRGFDRFRALYREQHDILTDGTFVKDIAIAIARLESPVNVCINDQKDQSHKTQDAARILLENGGLSSLMIQPLSWREIDDNVPNLSTQSGSAHFPARILSELFIAICKASPVDRPLLKEYHIERLPAQPNFDHSCLRPSYDSWGWEHVRAAAAKSSLQAFVFDSACWHRSRESHLSSRHSGAIQTLFTSFLPSSASLKVLALCLMAFYVRLEGMGEVMRINNFFSPIPDQGLPHLERLNLGYFQIRQSELERLSAAIGDSLREVVLESIVLDGDSWVNVLEILRGAIKRRRIRQGRLPEHKKPVHVVAKFTGLYGGEFGPQALTPEMDLRTEEGRRKFVVWHREKEEIEGRVSIWVSKGGLVGMGREINPLQDPDVRSVLGLSNPMDEIMEQGLASLFGSE